MMMKQSRSLRMVAGTVTIALLLLGCQNGGLSGSNQQLLGAAIGATAGGLLGSQFGSGTGKLAFTGLGVAAGAFIGSQIAAKLTEKDKEQMEVATEEALDSPASDQPVVWDNPESGASGTTTASEPYYSPVPEPAAGAPGAQADSRPSRLCRDVDQVIQTADGQSETAQATACQNENGEWEIAA
jgi:surface antigen